MPVSAPTSSSGANWGARSAHRAGTSSGHGAGARSGHGARDAAAKRAAWQVELHRVARAVR
eukprot:1347207-Prymnesium_polylepis.1